MGNCQACMNDPQQLSEHQANMHQKSGSLQFNPSARNSRPVSRQSMCELNNNGAMQSQHKLEHSKKPSIQPNGNEIQVSKEGIINENNQTENLVNVILIHAHYQSLNSRFSIECHCPPPKFGVQWNRQPKEMNSLISSPASETLQRLGTYQYQHSKFDDSESVYLGPYVLDNEAIYDGQWKFGLRHGKGRQVWKDGSIYEGYWKNNQAHGQGRLIHSDGDVYDGSWLNDKGFFQASCGYGIYCHADGARYEGYWKDDKQDGDGTENWPDGTSYRGTYIQSKKQGQGLFKWPDGSYYEGEFLNNAIHGSGKYYWADGRIFIGEWRINKMHGHGEFKWPDGRKYNGYYINDKKEGHGIFEWPDGSKYVGQWEKGKQNGQGTVFDQQGRERKGVWKDGKISQWLDETQQQ